jgi:hypothetical protein
VSALLTEDKSSVVNAINSLKHYVDDIVSSSEVDNSPYASYADFMEDAGKEILPGKYAYVTFTSSDTRPTGGNWDKITEGDTWRLDCSSVAWSPIINMTAENSANLSDESGTNALKVAGSDLIINWLQSFRNNLKYLLSEIADKVDITNEANKVYGTATDTSPTTYTVQMDAYEKSTLIQRGEGGVATVGTPTGNNHAATKKYVDD